MPDIAMCINATCPRCHECYRHEASGTTPTPMRQSYTDFPGGSDCYGFMAIWRRGSTAKKGHEPMAYRNRGKEIEAIRRAVDDDEAKACEIDKGTNVARAVVVYSFVAGVLIVAVSALIMLAVSAAADDIHSMRETTITLRPSDEAAAEVDFQNHNVNMARDEITFTLSDNGVEIDVTFDWNANGDDDAITVDTHGAYTCIPEDCRIVVPENEAGTILLYHSGMAM